MTRQLRNSMNVDIYTWTGLSVLLLYLILSRLRKIDGKVKRCFARLVQWCGFIDHFGLSYPNLCYVSSVSCSRTWANSLFCSYVHNLFILITSLSCDSLIILTSFAYEMKRCKCRAYNDFSCLWSWDINFSKYNNRINKKKLFIYTSQKCSIKCEKILLIPKTFSFVCLLY